MDKKSLDYLLNALFFIVWDKSMLSLRLRGWVNALGLHVQQRKAGQWTRLQAGGSLRSYFDAWREGEGDWQIRKFDQVTWERRFTHVVSPTCDIAEYLLHYDATGGVDSEKIAILNEAIEHFKSTGEWLCLPGIPADLGEFSRQMVRLDPTKLNGVISYAESLRKDSKNVFDWVFLATLYDLAARYKEMENAVKTADELLCSEYKGSEWMVWRSRKTIGMLYFAALSNSTSRQDVIVLGSIPSKVTAESLGYTIDEVGALAKENLEAVYADANPWRAEVDQDTQELKQIEEAIAVCKNR